MAYSVVQATIGGSRGQAFIVDTGADRSMVFSRFANAHPQDVDVTRQGSTIKASFPFIGSIYGVGGKVDARPVQVASLRVGTVTFANWPLEVSANAPAFECDDYDGLIGQDVLRYFDVYFDYAHTTMYLVPNERYRERWGS